MAKLIIADAEELAALLSQTEARILAAIAEAQANAPAPEPGPAGDGLLTKKQAAGLLAVSCSTVDNYARAGRLTRHYIGKSVRFARGEVLGLASGKRYS